MDCFLELLAILISFRWWIVDYWIQDFSNGLMEFTVVDFIQIGKYVRHDFIPLAFSESLLFTLSEKSLSAIKGTYTSTWFVEGVYSLVKIFASYGKHGWIFDRKKKDIETSIHEIFNPSRPVHFRKLYQNEN